MGCFDYRCCVTGLPIRAGDPVKFILLGENPYERDTIIRMGDYWYLRTWPLRAEYNDYGSIDEFDLSSPGVWAVVEGLKKDLVEVGTGDNSCHDVPTRRGMSFDDILTAVSEGRILVDSDFDFNAERRKEMDDALNHMHELLGETREPIFTREDPPPPVGLPTLQNVRTLLEEKGYKANESRYSTEGADGYLVDEQDHGWIRIRHNSYDQRTEGLQKILPLLQEKYAAMLTAGSGNYADDVEIHVMPLPNKEQRLHFRQNRNKKPLKLWQGMILTSAWDAMLERSNYTKLREEVQAEWNRLAAPLSDIELLTLGMRGGGSRVSGLFFQSEIPFTMGLGEHMQLITAQHRKQPFSEQQVKDFLDDVTGLACLYKDLHDIRYWWKPSWYGGQGSEYESHQYWHTVMAEVSAKLQHKLDEERAKWDAEEGVDE